MLDKDTGTNSENNRSETILKSDSEDINLFIHTED